MSAQVQVICVARTLASPECALQTENVSKEPDKESNEDILVPKRFGVRPTHADKDTLPAFARTSFFQKASEF